MEVSKAVIRIKKTSSTYSFFHFVVCVVNIMRCNDEFSIYRTSDAFKTEEFWTEFDVLMNKFGSASEYKIVAFSLSQSQVVLLLHLLEIITQTLLTPGAEKYNILISKKLFLTHNWVADFFSRGQLIMEALKESFEHIPLYNKVLKTLKDVTMIQLKQFLNTDS